MRIILLCLLFSSCAAPVYLIDKASYTAIPKNSTKVIAAVPYNSDSLYNVIEKVFSSDGWTVKSNKSAMQISCDPKSIGSGTLIKPLIYIESTSPGATAYFSGEVGLDQDGQVMLQALVGTQIQQLKPIIFEGVPTRRSDLGFQKLIQLANGIKDVKISYK